MSFASPSAALQGIATCLSEMSTRIHTGAAGSGETLDCCDDERGDPLIRVETAPGRAKNGAMTLARMGRNRCADIVMEVDVIYSACYQSFDGDGPEGVPIDEATKQGMAFVNSWEEALKRLACCEPTNLSVRFQSVQDNPPSGGCAGWSMRLEVDVSMCNCADVT